MEADGGGALHRDRRTSKLSLVVAAQNVLVTACLLVTLYVYWDVKIKKEPVTVSDQNVHIQFNAITDIPGGQTLKFEHIISSSMMNLTDDSKSKIYVACTGPYILSVDVCYINLGHPSGVLELHVEKGESPVSTFVLQTSGKDCRGLHRIAHLRKEDQASLYLNSTRGFKIKTVTVSFNYLLTPCEL